MSFDGQYIVYDTPMYVARLCLNVAHYRASAATIMHSLTMYLHYCDIILRTLKELMYYADTPLNPTLLGLGLTYTFTLTGMFQYCVKQGTEVENIVSHCHAMPCTSYFM